MRGRGSDGGSDGDGAGDGDGERSRSRAEKLGAKVAGRGEVLAATVGDAAAVFAEYGVAPRRFVADSAVDSCRRELG